MKITSRMQGWLAVLLVAFCARLLVFLSPRSEDSMEGAIGGAGSFLLWFWPGAYLLRMSFGGYYAG